MVVIEDVDVVEAHSTEALVEARQQVLTRAEVTVGPGPHVPARLSGDDEFVAQAGKVFAQETTEVDLRAPVGRSVIVGEVEVGDPPVERATEDRTLHVNGDIVTEVMPETE